VLRTSLETIYACIFFAVFSTLRVRVCFGWINKGVIDGLGIDGWSFLFWVGNGSAQCH
jgi:hypothetical protein